MKKSMTYPISVGMMILVLASQGQPDMQTASVLGGTPPALPGSGALADEQIGGIGETV